MNTFRSYLSLEVIQSTRVSYAAVARHLRLEDWLSFLRFDLLALRSSLARFRRRWRLTPSVEAQSGRLNSMIRIRSRSRIQSEEVRKPQSNFVCPQCHLNLLPSLCRKACANLIWLYLLALHFFQAIEHTKFLAFLPTVRQVTFLAITVSFGR